MSYQLHIGDSLEVLKTLPANSIDSVVTDPPYGLEFMGKAWDSFSSPRASISKPSERDKDRYAKGNSIGYDLRNKPTAYIAGKGFQDWCEQWAVECLRVLKPGGHLVAFGGARTYHRLASGIEDAGFEIRDKLDWIYGSGFPKSLDVSKAIDKAAGAEREVIGNKPGGHGLPSGHLNKTGGSLVGGISSPDERDITAPSTDAAKQWEGWGTALKPAHEPIVLARKPLDARPLTTVHLGIKTNNTVAANVLEHGTGALNIDGCRVGTTRNVPASVSNNRTVYGATFGHGRDEGEALDPNIGRWPPNILLSHSPYCTNIRQRRIEDPASWDCAEGCPVQEMDRQSGIRPGFSGGGTKGAGFRTQYVDGENQHNELPATTFNDTGGASRFFPIIEWDDLALEFNFKYQAKATKRERPAVEGVAAHPTVKPVALMRWLAKLVTPPGGKVLEPFGGSGTTAEACELEGFDCIIIEREPDYAKLINARMAKYAKAKEVA